MTIVLKPEHIGALAKLVKPAATKRRNPTNPKAAYDKLHGRIMKQLVGLPKHTEEHIFHPERKWRMDYAWPECKIALEVHGATYSQGRHTRGAGFAGDREKMNEAQLHGWLVIEVATDNIKDLRGWLERAFEIRGQNI